MWLQCPLELNGSLFYTNVQQCAVLLHRPT